MATKLEELTDAAKVKFKGYNEIPDIIISNTIKNTLIKIFKDYWRYNCYFNDYTFVVETSTDHFSFMPNQYFYYAVELYDLATILKRSFDIFDKYFKDDEKAKKIINSIQAPVKKGTRINYKEIEEKLRKELTTANDIFAIIEEEEKNNFCFLIGNLAENKKFGNLENNTFRGTADLYGSYLLNVVPFTTAESGTFGDMMYALASNPSTFADLCKNIKIQEKKQIIEDDNNKHYEQKIYYGVPGSGKSFQIDEVVKKLEEQPVIEKVKYTRRIVFHPEYTNADFIGQILPEMENSGIKYNFIPGNFTKILKDAYRNPDKNFALIIEEINRGNAAAIFGDVFQLLDRLNENETDYSANDQFTYTCGWSKYGIDNTDIIHEIFKGKDGKYEPLFLKFGNQNLKLNYNSAIRLPPNLSIYATMNTSDQNVFTLDNAFQRRWDMQLVKNECTDSKQMDSKITVKDTYITWKDFQEQINKVICEKSNESGLSSMEDKRLGCWFVKAENGIISAETFANKVLKYLWDDAFKFYHTEIFKDGIKNFEDLQKEFLNIGFDVFNDVCELTDKIHKFFTFNFDKE